MFVSMIKFSLKYTEGVNGRIQDFVIVGSNLQRGFDFSIILDYSIIFTNFNFSEFSP